MSIQDFYRSPALNNIPKKKLQDLIKNIENSVEDLQIKNTKITAVNRYYDSNIPLEYWNLKMDKDFRGDPNLLNFYNSYIENLKSNYYEGKSLCLSGFHGTGKTMTLSNIIKKASQKGYNCLYTTLSDVVSALTINNNDDKYLSKRELILTDFLAIDEVDIRFIGQSENANELFGRTFENILRTRKQNKLPVLMATNSPNIEENFQSYFKDSLRSLFAQIEIIPVFGKDARKEHK